MTDGIKAVAADNMAEECLSCAKLRDDY